MVWGGGGMRTLLLLGGRYLGVWITVQSWEGEVPRQVGGMGYGRVTSCRIVMPHPPFTRAMFTRTTHTTRGLHLPDDRRWGHTLRHRHALRFALGNSFKC